jgi:hypothetical protein
LLVRGFALPTVHVRFFQIPRWKIALGAILFAALLIALFILAAGVFLLVLPIAAIAGAMAYLFGGRKKPSGPSDGIIEAEYREIDQKELERDKR